MDGGSGNDTISGSYGSDEITGGPGADKIDGGTANDVIRVADDAQDTVNCGSGKDTVYVEETAPTRDLLTGCETIVPIAPEPSTDAPPTTNVIAGTPGDEPAVRHRGRRLDLRRRRQRRAVRPGRRTTTSTARTTTTSCTADRARDEVHGRGGNDIVLGNEDDDRVFGERGNDVLDGGPGNDTLFAGLDNDTVQGGEGDDTIQVVAGGFDRVACGPGNDTVYADATDEVAADCETVKR